MKKILLVDIIALFFMVLFVYTGVAKLTEIHLVKEQLSSSPFLGPLAGIVTCALPIGEILLAIGLMIPRLRLKALYATLGLMSLFTIYVVVLLFIDDHLSCSCGGIIEELSPKQHVLFNTACVILSAVAIIVERRQALSARFKWTTATSTLCLFLLLGWTLFTAFTGPATVKTGMEGRLLPAFDLLLTDSSTHFNTATIPTGEPVIVIGFSPWCIHCQAETRDIIKHMQQLKNTRIYYVTAFPFGQMKEFYKFFKLAQYPNIVMGRDSTNYFLKYFKATGVPYTAIFDSKKRLKQIIPGEAKAALVAQFALE
jgi:thiol-disulfide isomerase/thioredoxin